MRYLPLSVALLVAAIFGSAVAKAQDTHDWIDPNGGIYGTFSDWNPFGLPSSLDTARFSQSTDYTVSFLQDREAATLLILDGGVTFQSTGTFTGDRVYDLENATVSLGAQLNIQRGSNDKGFSLTTSENFRVRGDYEVRGGAQSINTDATVSSSNINSEAFALVTGENVSGVRSFWDSDHLDIGDVNNGKVRIDDGGWLRSSTVTLGGLSSGDGKLEVSGRGGFSSRLQVDDTLTIGVAGSGTVLFENGGFGTSTAAVLGDQAGGRGHVTIEGKPLNAAGAAWVSGNLNVKRGDIEVNRGGGLTSTNTSIGENATSSIKITGTGASGTPGRWTAIGLTSISNGADAMADIQNGGLVGAQDVNVGQLAGSMGTINVSSSNPSEPSEWIQSGDLYLGGSQSGAGGSGQLNLLQNSLAVIQGDIKIWNGGNIAMQSDSSTLITDSIDNSEGGNFDFLRGTLQARSFVGDLINQEGTLAPYDGNSTSGGSAGLISIDGDYTQQSGGILAIDIDGTECGVSYDHVSITDNGNLGGLLELTLLDDFVPDPTDVFNILSSEDLSGQFDNAVPGTRLTTTDGLGSFLVNYGSASPFNGDHVVLSEFQLANGILGDFDFDGDVDADDIDFYSGNIGQKAVGDLAKLDLDNDGMVTLADHDQHVTTLVQTSNGEVGALLGDINLDGNVNVLGDAFTLISNLGSATSGWSQGDLNADGNVNVLGDAFRLVGNLGQSNASSSALKTSSVPEPNAILFLAASVLTVVSRRKK